MRLVICVLFVLVLGGAEVFGQQRLEPYACAALDMAGFIADKPTMRYRRSGFQNSKFLMKFDGRQAFLKREGKTREETYSCTVPWQARPHLYQCVERFYFLVFDSESLRFSMAEIFGYVDRSDDSMTVTYGECQKF
jgi:hypothetical protein